MSTQQLSDVVRAIINDWTQQDKLFTALDVSVEVKKTLPHARHREVREVVRGEYANMQNSSYGKTDIDVTLDDGSAAKAILYHPLSDSWDLDAKYGAQQRAQTLKSQAATVVTPVSVTPVTPAPQQSIGDLIKQKLAQSSVGRMAVAPAPVAVNPNKHLWDALFDTQPSLFPRR
jgi:hypothetical protein